jgi:hypothetical protein
MNWLLKLLKYYCVPGNTERRYILEFGNITIQAEYAKCKSRAIKFPEIFPSELPLHLILSPLYKIKSRTSSVTEHVMYDGRI